MTDAGVVPIVDLTRDDATGFDVKKEDAKDDDSASAIAALQQIFGDDDAFLYPSYSQQDRPKIGETVDESEEDDNSLSLPEDARADSAESTLIDIADVNRISQDNGDMTWSLHDDPVAVTPKPLSKLFEISSTQAVRQGISERRHSLIKDVIDNRRLHLSLKAQRLEISRRLRRMDDKIERCDLEHLGLRHRMASLEMWK
jgi:hypothetical protein